MTRRFPGTARIIAVFILCVAALLVTQQADTSAIFASVIAGGDPGSLGLPVGTVPVGPPGGTGPGGDKGSNDSTWT
ncbi:hypothetical protein [Nonomuraea zeae]|uniref:Collagen-like protein n=1 Tax=Nonomuraea zeae TaxID=1642303 RepID=A0A5S4F6A4_9ACTN|nr:hypothetical protein [Nonomuraea zeae]TMR11659.1 hypothetical protein ETD85_59135 [Nonomuraea zeae]